MKIDIKEYNEKMTDLEKLEVISLNLSKLAGAILGQTFSLALIKVKMELDKIKLEEENDRLGNNGAN